MIDLYSKKLLSISFFALVVIVIAINTLKVLYPQNNKNITKYIYLNHSQTQDVIGCTPRSFNFAYVGNTQQSIFEGQTQDTPLFAYSIQNQNVLGVSDQENDNKWIEVDLSEQWLKAWEDDKLYLYTPISSGLPWTPTPKGTFYIWIKLQSTKMEGGQGDNYYYLPNVPYVMFFSNEQYPSWLGYGIHGAYWHDDFGQQRSHGCVNLPPNTAEKLYFWSTPALESNPWGIRANELNPGTKIIIHE